MTDRNNHTNNLKKKFSNSDLDVVIYPTIRSKLSTATAARTSSTKTAAYTITASGFPSMNVQIGSINGLYYGMEMVAVANDEESIYSIAYLYQNKTNYYKNPDISNNLYTLSDNLEKIKEKHAEENKDDAYRKLDNMTDYYLKEYSNNNKSSVKESLLLSLYNLLDKNMK